MTAGGTRRAVVTGIGVVALLVWFVLGRGIL